MKTPVSESKEKEKRETQRNTEKQDKKERTEKKEKKGQFLVLSFESENREEREKRETHLKRKSFFSFLRVLARFLGALAAALGRALGFAPRSQQPAASCSSLFLQNSMKFC